MIGTACAVSFAESFLDPSESLTWCLCGAMDQNWFPWKIEIVQSRANPFGKPKCGIEVALFQFAELIAAARPELCPELQGVKVLTFRLSASLLWKTSSANGSYCLCAVPREPISGCEQSGPWENPSQHGTMQECGFACSIFVNTLPASHTIVSCHSGWGDWAWPVCWVCTIIQHQDGVGFGTSSQGVSANSDRRRVSRHPRWDVLAMFKRQRLMESVPNRRGDGSKKQLVLSMKDSFPSSPRSWEKLTKP